MTLDPSQSEDWRLRAEIHAQRRDWKQAALNIREYLLLKPDQNWLMLDGVVAGPYTADLKRHCPPEGNDFFGAHAQRGKEVELPVPVIWKRVPHSSQGIVGFRLFTEYSDHVSVYALFPIYSLDDRQVAILVGSDDHARLWLNGEFLYESLRSRIAVPDEDAVSARLKSGWNTLLVRVANETGDHALCLRLSDSEADLARAHSSVKAAP